MFNGKTRRFIKILTIVLFIVSCSNGRPRVDLPENLTEIEIGRFEKDLFSMSDEEFDKGGVEALKDKYGPFYKLFVEGIIAAGRAEDSSTGYYLNHFRTEASVRDVYETVEDVFPDLNSLENELSAAFSKFTVLFPEQEVPAVRSFVSGFSYTIVVDDGLLGIGLDMYLGNEKNFYERLGIPAYKQRRMKAEYIPCDAMKSWIGTEFEMDMENADLLSYMIYHGKLLYTLDLLLDDTPDSVKIGYTRAQMDWMHANLSDMWFHIADNELFYTKDGEVIQKFIGDSPFTPGFPEGSPGMTGRWMGWQIVRKYMEQQEDPLDAASLFAEKDAQKILRNSTFKP